MKNLISSTGRIHVYFTFRILMLFLALLMLVACDSAEYTELEFIIGKASVYSEPPMGGSTTMCRVSIVGDSECDLKILVPSSSPLCIGAGRVNFWCNYEWYDEKKTIVIEQEEGCEGISELVLGYEFSGQYFGQHKKAGNMNCR